MTKGRRERRRVRGLPEHVRMRTKKNVVHPSARTLPDVSMSAVANATTGGHAGSPNGESPLHHAAPGARVFRGRDPSPGWNGSTLFGIWQRLHMSKPGRTGRGAEEPLFPAVGGNPFLEGTPTVYAESGALSTPFPPSGQIFRPRGEEPARPPERTRPPEDSGGRPGEEVEEVRRFQESGGLGDWSRRHPTRDKHGCRRGIRV